MPNQDEIKNLTKMKERDLGQHLDVEYEIGMEFLEELIPYSVEYFLGVKHDTEEFMDYMDKQI
jgi:hypothetical protein